MTVESRAVRASRSIRMSVNAVHPAGVGVITRRHRAGWAVAFSLVGLLAGAAVALATVLPTATNDDIAGPPTTAAPVVTTIPSEPGPPIIIPPVDGEERESQDADDAAELIMADGADGGFDDPSVPGGSWDDFAFGIDWVVASTTTTTEPEGPTNKTTQPPGTSITAGQYFGPEHGQPTEKLYGTAPPGSEVSATNPYASASMTVGGTGEYSLVISFSNPPPNESFTISVTVAGEPFTLSFMYVVV